MSHNKGFTLAETLVTIGIIGIVAAMTIPALINRYKTFVLMQQFKKVYAAISVAAEKVQFDMGENVKCFYGPGGSWADCRLFFNELAKQLNVIQVCDGKALERGCLPKEFYKKPEDIYKELYPNLGSDEVNEYFSRACPGFSTENIKNNNTVYVLNGGFLIITYYNRGSAPLFIVDINGKNRPNKRGHDLFIFRFSKRKLSDSYFVFVPSTSCGGLVEKGGFTAIEFFNLVNRGTANF